MERECAICGQRFAAAGRQQVCGEACRRERSRRRAVERRGTIEGDWQADAELRRSRRAAGRCVVCAQPRPESRAWTCGPEHERLRRGYQARAFVGWAADRLTFSRGRWAGQPFQPPGWSEPVLEQLFGETDADGRRRFRRLIISVPKKSAKTELAAALGLWSLMESDEGAPEVYLAAATVTQCRSSTWMATSRMARSLLPAVKIAEHTMTITYPGNGGVLRVIGVETGSGKLQGCSPSVVICDEVHAWTSSRARESWEALTSPEASAARAEPLVIALTTAGRRREGLGWELVQHARAVAAGEVEDRRLLPVLWEAPDDAPWDDPATAEACNPMLGVTITREHIMEGIERARRSPRERVNWEQWRLNRWTELSDSPWLDIEQWDQGRGAVAPIPEGVAAGAGLDVGHTTDLSCLALTWREGEHVHCRVHSWLPEGALASRRRTEQQRQLLQGWIDAGIVRLVPGTITDYRRLEADVRRLLPQDAWVGYDRWSMEATAQRLTDAGWTCSPIIQSPRGLTTGSRELERLVADGLLVHGGDPLLRHAASRTRLKSDAAGYVQPSREDQRDIVDPIVAICMALDQLMRRPPAAATKRRPFVRVRTIGRRLTRGL